MTANKFVPIVEGVYQLNGLGEVHLDEFEIAKFPTTRKWFRDFIIAGGYGDATLWTEQGSRWLAKTQITQPKYWDDPKWSEDMAPVVGVSWYEAAAFVAWLSRTAKDNFYYMLPTESQWQATAAGKEGRTFPWGDTWSEDQCNWGDRLGKTSHVDAFPQGATPIGVLDMIGNVWEWTVSDFYFGDQQMDFPFDARFAELIRVDNMKAYVELLENPASRLPVIRGGSWVNEANSFNNSKRNRINPDLQYNSIGFRVLRKRSASAYTPTKY